mmetsp:Transcript_24007/g.60758  ORF Transcript_24007/g.60758 Transcript_24007/m.60758 type:complete len:229 (-) Transcript_24007:28-714(-)
MSCSSSPMSASTRLFLASTASFFCVSIVWPRSARPRVISVTSALALSRRSTGTSLRMSFSFFCMTFALLRARPAIFAHFSPLVSLSALSMSISRAAWAWRMGFFSLMGSERRRIDSGSLLASLEGAPLVLFFEVAPCAWTAPPSLGPRGCWTKSRAGESSSDAVASPPARPVARRAAAPGLASLAACIDSCVAAGAPLRREGTPAGLKASAPAAAARAMSAHFFIATA